MKHRLLFTTLLLHLLLLLGCRSGNTGQRQLPNMRPSFLPYDKNPGGTYVANQLFQQVFKGFNIGVNKLSFTDYYKDYTELDDSRSGELYCIISRQFYPNDDDLDAMESFLSNGNTLFISSNSFGEDFLNKFHLKSDGYSLLSAEWEGESMTETGLTTLDTSANQKQQFHFFYQPLLAQLQRDTAYKAQQLTQNDSSQISGLVFRHGQGRMIVMANASALTNYFLLSRNNYQYLEHLMSYVPDMLSSISWDTYYNNVEYPRSNGNNDDGSFSAFQELMRQPPMRWAFWLTVLLAATWIINGIIRRQRPIEVIKPNTNSSVEFAETIGRLYLLKKDNKNIATKMITYFLEYVRGRYYLTTGRLDDHFTELLATKSGQTLTDTQNLLKTFDKIKVRDHISDTELLELNAQIRPFLK